MEKQDYIKMVIEIAQDIDEERGCPACGRIKWVKGYTWWPDCVESLGYVEAVTILEEACEKMEDTNRRELLTVSEGYKKRLVKRAKDYIRSHPHMANASTFWRGMSAQQLIAAATK
jgi:hypothetical protein